jgi:hypothetical protein
LIVLPGIKKTALAPRSRLRQLLYVHPELFKMA